MTVTRMILVAGLLGTAATAADAAAFSKQVPIAPQGIVEIRNVSGKVTVTAWTSNAVEVRGDR